MTQPFDPAPQTTQPPLPDRSFEIHRMQMAAAELMRQIKRGANSFYWIAALSVINSLVLQFGGSSYFAVGLAATLFVTVFSLKLQNQLVTLYGW